ncbi:MAG: formylglycine-generating enzyme family protein, partial [Kiritimatiellae bacterium]|nr:formylglycine-generating enzyme family protein [Kiritimatiellia bacterium]
GDALYAVAGESVNLSLECISGGEEPRFSVSAGMLAADGAAYALVLPDPGQDVTVSVTSRPAVRDVSATIDGGKANVSFWLAGTVAADCPDWNMPFLSVTATDLATGATYVAAPGTLSGDTGTSSGAHNVVWDFGAQGIELSGNVSFTVSYLVMPLYCVIDLSGGTNAENYAVTYLDAEPEGGFTNDLYKTEKLVMRLIAPGTFKMNGETETEITNAFYCAVFETTQKQWELVKGDNPSNFKDDADSPMRPVEQVSWNMIRGNSDTYDWPNTNAVDATSFLGVFRLKSGLAALDLPTEAQWEYACRAGTTTTYSYGDTADGNYMWYEFNSTDQTHAVGTKRPNAWDLYDMHGNVWEWCLDLGWGSYRVERGGCWRSYADSCSSSNRNDYDPSYDYYLYGFRLVRTCQTVWKVSAAPRR